MAAVQQTLKDADPEMFEMLLEEEKRQFVGLELIASENFTSRAVMETLGTCFTNKYSEGLPGARYYGGNEVIDRIENLCIKRAQKAFRLDPAEWGVNVQPYSGSTANFAAFVGALDAGDRIMGLDLPSGGHLTHGYYTATKKGTKKVSATSIFFESFPYKVCADTGIVDYDQLERDALTFRPKLIIAGASAYPREWDYKRMREIADKAKSLLMTDMAHFSGLVASQVLDDPFEYSDIVTTTTHKSLRGPRAGLIFFKKGTENNIGEDLEAKINFAVFPSCQGGPHNNTIAAVAVQLKEVDTPAFREYSQQVVKNCQALGKRLTDKGYTLATGGTDNHLLLWNLRPQKLTGSKFSVMCDAVSITLNKNAIHGDQSAMTPGGVRVGTPALTSRGFKEKDFEQVGEFLARAVDVALAIQKETGRKLASFKAKLQEERANPESATAILRAEVEKFASGFEMPGLPVAK